MIQAHFDILMKQISFEIQLIGLEKFNNNKSLKIFFHNFTK